MTSYMASKRTKEVTPKHSIMTELQKKAAADQPEKAVKNWVCLLFDPSPLTSGFNLDEPTPPAGRIRCVISLGLNLDIGLVLGTMFHTASYLCIWVLLLARQQLSHVSSRRPSS